MTSEVAFDATGGQLYQIAIDGVSGATGNLVLTWGPPCRLSIQQLSRTSVGVTLAGRPGTYAIEGSTDLANWGSLTNVSVTGSSQEYTNNSLSTVSRRFYRARLVR